MGTKDNARNTLLESNGDSSRESGIDDGSNEHEIPEDAGGSTVPGLITASGNRNRSDSAEYEAGCGPVQSPSNDRGDGDSESNPAAELDSSISKDNGEEEERRSVKKQTGFDAVISQQRRRKEALVLQKQRRDEILDKIRQLEDSAYSDSETEDEMDFVASVREAVGVPQTLEGITEEAVPESMEVTLPKSRSKRKNRKKQWHPRHKQPPCRPMLSEWLLEVPEDFEEMWLGVVCPVGKRCIVMASRGKTKIFSRSDQYLGAYKSLLPGGCKYHYKETTTNRNRGVTILDCIWSQETETFYVLDMLCWNSHSCLNCDTEYRQFFLHSKFSENLELLERSPSNPFPFKPLTYFAASDTSSALSSRVTFSENIDGVLFFHKEAFYISETNPLCLWILLTQVESILNTYVTPELLARQVKPKNLKSREKQIERLECSQGQGMDV